MIFSRLFAPSHTSQNPEKRREAIKNLSPEKPTDKTLLHELAFNDENADVSLDALNKLGSFVLWQKMSQIAKHERVQRTANKVVLACLMGEGEITISRAEKAAFLKESASGDLVQQVVLADPELLHDISLAKVLIEKVAKPAFFQNVFLHYASGELQAVMLSMIDDLSLLQKLEKKTKGQAIHSEVQARVNAHKEASEKPKRLLREITLCLSKYNALLDKSDVEDIENKQATLEGDYKALLRDASILSEQDKDEVEQKYLRISQSLERYLARLRPEWEAKQAKAHIEKLEALCNEQRKHATQQVDWLYYERLCDATIADVAVVNESVRALEATFEHLENTSANSNLVDKTTQTLSQLNEKITAFSMQQQYAQKLLVVIADAESLADTVTAATDTLKSDSAESQVESVEEKADSQSNNVVDVKVEFNALNEKFDGLKAQLSSIPKGLMSRWKKASARINKQHVQEKANIDAKLRQCRKQLSVIESLIEQGRYRAAMAKFEKVRELVSSSDEGTQKAVAKRFEGVAEEISRLEGWQSYIAGPRKPALLEEAKRLALTPMEDVKSRTESIRYLRQQWLSLGSSAEDKDTLQVAFDDALEQAFQPCRDYYADMDAKREEAKLVREAIVADAQSIDLSQPEATVVKVVDRLSKAWHQAGQVDKKDYESLKRAWKTAIAPAQDKIHAWNMANKEQKQALVAEAEQLAGAEALAGASEKAQQLQAQWKTIGHAGKRDESRLWKSFKQANDTLFERLKAQRKAQSNEFDAQFSQLMDSLSTADEAANESEVNDIIARVEEAAAGLPHGLKAKLQKRIATLTASRDKAKIAHKKAQQDARATAFAEQLRCKLEGADEALKNSESHAALLGKRWTNLFSHASGASHSRHWLTVALEAVAEMPTPEADANLRTDVQLTMMTAKLEHGEQVDPVQLLEDWVAIGDITADEGALVERVIAVVNARPEWLG